MMFDDGLTSVVVNHILSVTQPRKIIVFLPCNDGEGEDRIGVLVLTDQIKRGAWESIRIQTALQSLGRAFDVLVMGTDYFEQTRDVLGSPAWPAATYGRVVYPMSRTSSCTHKAEPVIQDPESQPDSAARTVHRARLSVGSISPVLNEWPPGASST